jgi:hypothetical protein
MLSAAVLLGLVAVAHSYLGERYILIRLLRRNDLPNLFGGAEFTKQTLRLAWHITSVMGLGFAAILITLASPGGAFMRTAAEIISVTSAVSGVLAFVGSRGRHLSWIAFFAVAALTWLGSH